MSKYPVKILMIKNLVFALNDDFDGDLFDALEQVIKYHRTRNNPPQIGGFGEKLDCYDYVMKNWKKERLALLCGLGKLNEAQCKYDEMEIVKIQGD